VKARHAMILPSSSGYDVSQALGSEARAAGSELLAGSGNMSHVAEQETATSPASPGKLARPVSRIQASQAGHASGPAKSARTAKPARSASMKSSSSAASVRVSTENHAATTGITAPRAAAAEPGVHESSRSRSCVPEEEALVGSLPRSKVVVTSEQAKATPSKLFACGLVPPPESSTEPHLLAGLSVAPFVVQQQGLASSKSVSPSLSKRDLAAPRAVGVTASLLAKADLREESATTFVSNRTPMRAPKAARPQVATPSSSQKLARTSAAAQSKLSDSRSIDSYTASTAPTLHRMASEVDVRVPAPCDSSDCDSQTVDFGAASAAPTPQPTEICLAALPAPQATASVLFGALYSGQASQEAPEVTRARQRGERAAR